MAFRILEIQKGSKKLKPLAGMVQNFKKFRIMKEERGLRSGFSKLQRYRRTAKNPNILPEWFKISKNLGLCRRREDCGVAFRNCRDTGGQQKTQT